MPTAPQFEWPQGEPLFETQWRAVTESLAGNGVLDSGDLALTPGTANREVSYAAGTVYYVATQYNVTAGSVTVSAGDANNDRWDTIAFDTTGPSVVVKEGTPAANPEPPDVTGGEILLGVVYVPQNFDDVLASSQILNWRGRVSNEAQEVLYTDSTGVYGVNNVDAALDELQEAAQITAYPLNLDVDTDMDAAGNDLVDGATTIWDTTNGYVPRGSLDDKKAVTTVSTATYTTSDEEIVLVDTATIAAASTVTLASADAVEGNTIRISDLTGSARAYPITIDTEGAETIDGESTFTIDTAYNAIALAATPNGNWKITASLSGSGRGPPTEDFSGAETGQVSASSQGILIVSSLEPGETAEVSRAVLTTDTVEAVGTGVDLKLVTFDNAGGFTTQTTLAAGDGATIYDDLTGSPLASYENTGTAAESIGVIVDNTTTAAVDIVSDVEGRTGL